MKLQPITCPTCGLVRMKDYRAIWAIKKGINSKKCFSCTRPVKGKSNKGAFKKGCKPWNKEKPMSEETKQKVSKSRKGKYTGTNNHKWKGDKASYFAKHIWMFTNYGKATQCEECKITSDKKQIHWANISDKYKRERSDWKQLCVSHHSKFDRLKKLKNQK